MGGRRAISAEKKALRGNPGGRSIGNEPQPEVIDLATPPDWLCPEAVKTWNRLCPMLVKLGILAESDVFAFALLCDAHARYLEASKLVKENGVTYETTGTNGQHALKQNPATTIAAAERKALLSLLTEFGMTPASRSKVSIKAPRASDEMEEFLEQYGLN